MGKFVKTTEAGKRSGTGKLPRLVFFCDFIFTVERHLILGTAKLSQIMYFKGILNSKYGSKDMLL